MPNLQNCVRWTYENASKKSDTRNVYETSRNSLIAKINQPISSRQKER